ncbi:hypothetical protein SZ47_12420 [Brachyspira hyodysenteriae]|uniref:Uncharacterized protein n=1 Tax=Brachyspira hyodysenteriae ATCC 27164 TaxID=1266923 RepID=A0A3B6W0F3_BRAHO|nr:hypothetical protein [Brachyspira hyodysenteriae]ANN64610.1 hypothetical protein BHYOB78_12285 [Brachyspira hyodysenteriae ATCC 27164]KLI22779.1 hypothetical protein SZ47_12420 [Brachyspira hyodysenteriae]
MNTSCLELFLLYYKEDQNINQDNFFHYFDILYNKALEEIKNRLNNLPINKKEYSLEQISKEVFNLNIDGAERLNMYYKVQFEAMIYVFKDYYKIISNNFRDLENFYNNIKFHGALQYYLYLYGNILCILGEFEIRNGIKPIREFVIKNRVDSFEVFNSSLNLKNDNIPLSPLLSFNSSVFLIRQSIELKLKNMLGIDYILDIDNKELVKIPGDSLLDFVFNNKNIEIPDTIQKGILKKIHEWTQLFIHGGFIINIWQIHIAHIILKDLFQPNSYEHDDKRIFSIYGSVKMKKNYYDNQLDKEIIDYLKKTYKYVSNKNIEIIKLKNPEAIIY